MRGPQGKGHAEMAVTKQKDSGVETPTSEPGYSITDYDWEDADVSIIHSILVQCDISLHYFAVIILTIFISFFINKRQFFFFYFFSIKANLYFINPIFFFYNPIFLCFLLLNLLLSFFFSFSSFF